MNGTVAQRIEREPSKLKTAVRVCAAPPICPVCSKTAATRSGRYGQRHECCGLVSWNGKPLVDPAVLRLRKLAHGAFDHIWKTSPGIYPIKETGAERKRVAKYIARANRPRTYAYFAERLGLPPKDMHMANIEDPIMLQAVIDLARTTTPKQVRDWWKARIPAP